jgi:hypothetical protein
MRHIASLAFAVVAGFLACAGPAAAVDLMKGRTDLPEIVLGNDEGNDYAVSQKEIELESGKSYRLSITSKGGKEYKFFAPDFFGNTWIHQIVINHLEVHMQGARAISSSTTRARSTSSSWRSGPASIPGTCRATRAGA